MGIATDAVLDSPRVKQLSDGNPVGTVLGVSGDNIGFFGSTAFPQPAGNAQAAVTRGQACGMIATFSTSQSAPSSVTANTTAEQAFTIQSGTGGSFLLASGDVVYINKPTSQAGLGVGNVRYSASNSLGITMSNLTASNLTPTTSELYSGVILRGFNSLSATLSPASVAANTTVEQQFTVTGIRAGELVQVSKPTSQAGLDIVGVRAVSNNLVGITFLNATAAAITPTASQSYTFMCLGGLDAVNNELMAQVNIGTTQAAGVATISAAEIAAITITGLATTDNIMGVSKDTVQTGLGIAGYRVSAANSLGITWVNPTAAGLTPTASHVYQVAIRRPSPAAPLLIYTPTLTPVSVAANTTAEQTFTVTGLIAASPVWVNKSSSFQTGLGITGVRISAANTLAINYCNATGSAITPAAEQYTVGNFQLPYNSADGLTMLQCASGVVQQTATLVNGIRAALASGVGSGGAGAAGGGLNLIAGA